MDTFAFVLPALQVIAVDLLLGADNAMVIALACRRLPPRLRTRGVVAGALAVVAVRSALTAGAALLLQVAFLRLAGGLLLLVVALRLKAARHEEAPHEVAAHAGLAGAVATIVAADTVMSVDNVLAVAAAAQGNVAAIVAGLAVSIPVMVLFSRAILAVIARYPLVVVAGGALLGWIALRTALADPVLARIAAHAPWLAWAAPAAAALGVAAAGLAARRRRTTS